MAYIYKGYPRALEPLMQERQKSVAEMFTPVWPCPSCPPGTEYYRDVSLPDGKFIDYRCAGCGYRYRAEKP